MSAREGGVNLACPTRGYNLKFANIMGGKMMESNLTYSIGVNDGIFILRRVIKKKIGRE
jgi:hypothetical protein